MDSHGPLFVTGHTRSSDVGSSESGSVIASTTRPQQTEQAATARLVVQWQRIHHRRRVTGSSQRAVRLRGLALQPPLLPSICRPTSLVLVVVWPLMSMLSSNYDGIIATKKLGTL